MKITGFFARQYAPHDQENFDLFLDSAPDRWGRFLMNRREAQLAREENRPERKLLGSDYLLGVFDQNRMGALRFRLEPEGSFLDNNKTYATPPWAYLRELEQASLELEKEDASNHPNYSKWLQMLIVLGSSLGGARSKASVIDEQKHLWIAKFPSGNDEHDIGVWEMVAHKLAVRAHVNTPQSSIKKFNSPHHTFLSKRFDRTDRGERIHFASAMTLLQRSDGDDKSYLEMAEFIMQQGAKPVRDLEELWRRIVFFICIPVPL